MNFFCNLAAFFFQEEVNETQFGDLLMNTSEKDKCKRCGAVIRRESTEKLCPACLMSGALKPPGSKDQTASNVQGESLPLYEPSEFPCEFGGYRLLGLLGRGRHGHGLRS